MKPLSLPSLLLLVVTTVFAQDWQWQEFEGDYYHPTNFPQVSTAWSEMPVTDLAADLDGDGRDEFISFEAGGLVASLDPDTTRNHWTVTDGNLEQLPGDRPSRLRVAGSGDALLFYVEGQLRAFTAAVDNGTWTWSERAELTAELAVMSDQTVEAHFADFDGDGRMESILLQNLTVTEAARYERQDDGSWLFLGNLVTEGFELPIIDLYALDYDSDNDLDIVLVHENIDAEASGSLFGNSDGQFTPVADYYPFSGPAAGDFDGNGTAEGIFRYPGHSMYEWVEWGPGEFGMEITSEISLERMTQPVLGPVRVAAVPYVLGSEFGIERRYIMPDYWIGRLMMRTVRGWQRIPGDYWNFGGRNEGGNMGDVDGDGLLDMVVDIAYDAGQHAWWLMINDGTAADDHFGRGERLSRFYDNSETQSYLSPRLGDVDGNGRAELVMVSIDPDGVEFYELQGDVIDDSAFVLRPELSTGLPTGITAIAPGDLNGDGHFELAVKIGNAWHVYFFSGQYWYEQDVNLPAGASEWLTLADADNDGDADLFTPGNLFYNLTPVNAEAEAPLPRSFALSAWPNPFNARVEIRYELTHAGPAEISIFNILGEKAATLMSGPQESGAGRVTWQAEGAGGIYFVRLAAGETSRTLKLVYLK